MLLLVIVLPGEIVADDDPRAIARRSDRAAQAPAQERNPLLIIFI